MLDIVLIRFAKEESHSCPANLPGMEPDELLRSVMRRQAALSLRVAAVFLGIIFVLPLVNHFLPTVAAMKVGGFTLTWLILGVLFYPITWALSAYFIKSSNELEHQLAQEHGEPSA